VSLSYAAADSIFCHNDAAVTLTGTPAGGTFSGTGVTGNSFNPAGLSNGNITLSYSYTDSLTGCSNTSSRIVTITFCTGVNSFNVAANAKVFPNPNWGTFNLQ